MARRRRMSNALARALITLGGFSVIAVVIAIVIFIGYETLPLWKAPSITTISNFSLADSTGKALVIGEDEYRTVLFTVTDKGIVRVVRSDTLAELARLPLNLAPGDAIVAADIDQTSGRILAGSRQGRLILVHVDLGSAQGTAPPISVEWTKQILSKGESLKAVKLNGTEDLQAFLIEIDSSGTQRILAGSLERPSGIDVSEKPSEQIGILPIHSPGAVSSMTLDGRGKRMVLGTSSGALEYWERSSDGPVGLVQVVESQGKAAVSALEMLLGDRTIIVGRKDGSIETLTWVSDTASPSGFTLIPLNVFKAHKAAVTDIAVSARNKSFMTGDAAGEIALHYQTTANTFFQRHVGDEPVVRVSLSPKSNGAVVLLADGRIQEDAIDNPHPEVSIPVLFGSVQYEGYRKGSYTWQSTGGTDDFEPKLSLTPLLVGTIKGALYALVFALPMAIFAAMYTALFSHPKVKNIIKPIVEIMAALPSVVIGFIAALWLAPFVERMFIGIVVFVVVMPLSVFLAWGLWKLLPERVRHRLHEGWEILAIIPAIVILAAGAIELGSLIEGALFAGSFRQWLFDAAKITYDQRNSIVVGFAMGFAVIPIIFTISEDALSSVPEHMKAGSLALGATRWQTAVKVVLPTASPAIFSAVMIGFGRAVGETMIVLMATGNTAIMDLSPFLGMRTLSANIAVELPEAPYLGTLYRVLFVAGFLLFLFTFSINTIAEVVRQRLRKKYSAI
jgi:phosphate transport system permease protein